MRIGQELLAELEMEAAVTRKHLERIPFASRHFKPHPKSEELGRLAIHVAEIISWWSACIDHDKLDFFGFKPKTIETTEELLSYFDQLLSEAKNSLDLVADSVLSRDWSMTYGDEILFTLPKRQVLRTFCMNHLVHHRAQLGVYLRILDIPIPAVYGPSADEEEVLLIKRFL